MGFTRVFCLFSFPPTRISREMHVEFLVSCVAFYSCIPWTSIAVACGFIHKSRSVVPLAGQARVHSHVRCYRYRVDAAVILLSCVAFSLVSSKVHRTSASVLFVFFFVVACAVAACAVVHRRLRERERLAQETDVEVPRS